MGQLENVIDYFILDIERKPGVFLNQVHFGFVQRFILIEFSNFLYRNRWFEILQPLQLID